jgi:hypothetical protein
MNPIDPVDAPVSSEDRVGTVERMMEQSRALDAEAAAARAARPTAATAIESGAPSSAFEVQRRAPSADARLQGAPTAEAQQAHAERLAHARELDRLNQPGNRPITEGVRERTATLQTARAALDEQNRNIQEGLGRLGPDASEALRGRFREAFRSDPAYRQVVERERSASRDLAEYMRTNADRLQAEYPVGRDAAPGSPERLARAHGGNVAFHALASLAGSSEAGSAIELGGRLHLGGLLPDNRLRDVVSVAGPNDYLNRVRNGEPPDAARNGTMEALRGSLHHTSLARDLERTGTFAGDLARGGPPTAQGWLRGVMSGINAVHDVVKAAEGASAGRYHEALQDGLKAVTDTAEAVQDLLTRAGRGTALRNGLQELLERGPLRHVGATAAGIGVVNNMRDFIEGGDWRHAAAAVGEVAQGLAAMHPASRFLRMAGAAGSAVATLGRQGAEESTNAARLERHLGTALQNPRAARVFARNPRAIEVMRQAGLSEEAIVRRAGDPNARFMQHPADADQLRDLLRRERAGR